MFIPLRYKFLFVTALLLLASVSTFLYLATDLFNSDKKAYIYDSSAGFVEVIGEEINTSVMNIVKTIKLIAITQAQPQSSQQAIYDLFLEEDHLVDLAIYEIQVGQDLSELGTTPPIVHLINKDYLAPLNLDEAYLTRVMQEKPINFARVLNDSITLQNSSLKDGLPLLTIAAHLPARTPDEKSYIVTANLEQDRRLQMFNRSAVYSTYLIDQYGNLLAHREHDKTLAAENLANRPVINEILASKVEAGAREYQASDKVSYIASFRKLTDLNITVISEIPVKTAFAASERLIEKSILFAILILSVSFIVTLLFTRRMTATIQGLYEGTEQISQGNFDLKVPVKSNDEVGSLTKAFNKMTGEIVRLMTETADKARMEKELETAQLVQDNFFPEPYLEYGDYEISSYFKPASECGGDWWGYLPLKDSLIVMLGDATGHGVGAALITAAIHSCTSVLYWLHQNTGIGELSPAAIMASLNAAVYHTGKKKVKMTFFVASIDLKSGKVVYANASHDTPLTCPVLDEVIKNRSKKDLGILDGQPDPCLGQSLQTKFHEHTYQLAVNETLILYTDGLVECNNKDKEEFGERRLLQSILKSEALTSEVIKANIVEQAQQFYGDGKQSDDITLVILRRRAASSSIRKGA